MLQDTSARVIEASSPPKEPLYITLLASEWNSLAGGLSTLNREFAIHLAQQTNVRVSLLVPEGACNDRDKREAQSFNINVVEAKQRPGYEPLDWLGIPPESHRMDVVVGHGVKLGRQVHFIKCAPQFQNCKWVHTVHTSPEDLGKYKDYKNPTSRGEQKHWDEVGLCKCADLVVAVGPKLEKVYFSYLQGCKKREDIFGLIPGLFGREFGDIVQMPKTESDDFKVLLCGRGDNEDFELKGYDIAVKAFVDPRLKGKSYHVVFVGAPDGMQDEVRKRLLNHGITEEQLTVRKFVQCRRGIKDLLCEVDLAIMPSKSEGFGLVALEALSAGLPVLVGSNSGFASAIRDLPLGACSIVDSDDPAKWAEAIERVCVRHRVCLEEIIMLRECYGRKYVWKTQCKALVEQLWRMIRDDQGTSISQALAADASMEQQTVVIPEGICRGTQGKQPATKTTRQDSLFTSKQSEFAMRSETCVEPTQSGIFYAVFTHNSVVVKLLRAEYNRRAQLRPLFWDNTIQLPLEKVYTRVKIVSRRKGGNQWETEPWSDVIWFKDSRRDDMWPEVRANEANPCDVYGMLKENKDVMTIVEGSPGSGKTTFCLKLAYDWANQSGSAASFPEFKLVLLLKCRDIGGDLTETIMEQLFPKDMSKDAREELFRFLEDIENQERVLIILDGLDELAEKSKHYVDDLLHRKRWACCYVLATTRQEKGIEVRKQFVFNLFLYIEGFTEEDSFEYIRRHFKIAGPEHSSKGEKLIKEIKENIFLQDLQTNPLNLLLLCVVYEDHEGELPSSRTDLYHVIVVCLLRRYCAKHNVKARRKDRDLETQFEGDILCLGELAWNCLLNDRHSFFEEELEELETRNEKLVVRELGFVYKEESLKRLKPQHEYCFLHKSFQEYLAASYVAHKLQRNKFNVFEHLNFKAVVKKFPQVFLFVCGILREEASILFAQIGEKLKSDWDWLKCSEEAANFFIQSWSESGNAEGMANTLCSFMPFPRVVDLPCVNVDENEYFAAGFLDEIHDWTLLRVLSFCGQFSKVEAPGEIRLGAFFSPPPLVRSSVVRDLASLLKLKFLDFSDCFLNVESAHELFQRLPEFASLTELALPDVPEMTDWGIVTKALTTSKSLETVGCVLLGERGEDWARALDAGLCADTPLSSVDLTICGPMSETALQVLENLLLNKSLSSVSVIVKEDMSHSLAVTLSRALAGETVVKSLDLNIFGKLSFCCGNLIERGIVKNYSLRNLVVSLRGELPDNWQRIVENLNLQLAEKSTVTYKVYPSNLSPVTATQLTDVRPCVVKYGLFKQRSVTLNVWGELAVEGAEAIYNALPFTSVCHLTLNIHGKLTDDFLYCTARHVDKQKPLWPITINMLDQLSNEGRALFKELELDKNPAVTLNVCEVRVPSDESGDDKIVSVDNPASLIALLEEAENTGKDNLIVTINVPSCECTRDFSDDSTGRSWNDSLHLGLPRNCSLNSLTLTINNFHMRSTGLSLTLIGCLVGCSSLKSLTLTLNEYNEWKKSYSFLLCKGLGRNTSLIFLSLTLNIYTRVREVLDDFYNVRCDGFVVGGVVPNISINSFTLTINDFSSVGWGAGSDVLLCYYKSLTTFNVTLNRSNEEFFSDLPLLLVKWMKANSLKTLRLKINDEQFRIGGLEYDFSDLVAKIPSLELVELTIIRYGDMGSSLETLKWEKQ
ncbi:uncharacterized protein LOC114949013 [Acropora millepora]|uniref:uncharacterized protein LOC114949013 n=1 Tax=Acropora millepora TaxID=45264 RepID=UPI001CF346A1|nr:uncharacterized protein LOC114949013 [Acropora millepora]XP_044175057.1 uncharacterized protein LOC114949013 [Acropora millepora]XP_044175058.1 uncharacterized protein LOC114949013 [Acropora millepora]